MYNHNYMYSIYMNPNVGDESNFKSEEAAESVSTNHANMGLAMPFGPLKKKHMTSRDSAELTFKTAVFFIA